MATPIPDNRARFTLAELAQACGGELRGVAADAEVVGVVTDSGRVTAGNLYVALRGETHDGHAFARAACDAGAVAVLVARDAELAAELPAVVVDDTLRALGDIAALHRRRWGGRAVAITGSVGKTTTKELTFAALRATGLSVERTAGNLNNLIGLPMTLLALDPETELAVLEIGTSAPGEIARLAEIARPQVGVVTAVAVAHAEGLGTLEGGAREKASLLWALPEDGTAIYSADHEALCAELEPVRARKLSFGRTEGADVRLTKHSVSATPASRCEIAVANEPAPIATELSLFGNGPAIDAAAALAVVLAVAGMGALSSAAEGMASVEPPAGRLCPVPGAHGALLVDDSYNANPASVRASVETTLELARARGGRALLVLADMLELGASEAREHGAVGELASRDGVAAFVACGPRMRAAASVARLARPDLTVHHVDDAGEAAALIRPLLQPADVVLVKGSRSMKTERVIEALREGDSQGRAAT